MRKITQANPGTPFRSKPFFLWLTAAATYVVVLIMLGFGNNSSLALFQGNAIAQQENPVTKQQPDNTQRKSADVDEENKMENHPQWHLPKEAKMRLGKGGIGSIQFSPDGTQLVVGSRIGIWVYDVETGNEISLLQGLSGPMAYSPDGRFIASGGGDPVTSFGGSPLEKGLQLWNVSAGSKVSLQGELPPAKVLRFSNDSKTLVCLSMSRENIYWIDVETGEYTTTNMGKRQGYMHLESYTLIEDKIAIGSNEGKIELWDTATGKHLTTFREMGQEVRMPDYGTENNQAITMKFSPDGTRLAAGNLDTTIQIWDTTTGEELIVLQKPIEGNMWSISRQNGREILNNPMKDERNTRPSALAFSPDGTLLACGSNDCTVKLWNTITGELVGTFTGHISDVNLLAFSPDGNILASGSDDGTVRFWDIAKRKPLPSRIYGHMWFITASLLDDGSKLVSVSNNGIISVWDLKKFEKSTSITKMSLEEPLYWHTYRHLELTPDGTKLANHGIQTDPSKPNYNDEVLRLTDVNTGHDLMTIPEVYGEKFSPDGETLVSAAGNEIRLLNLETGEKREIVTSDHDEDSDEDKPHIRTAAFTPDGEKIVSGTMGGQVQFWDVETGMELTAFFEETPPIENQYEDPIQNIAFSSDSSLIAIGSIERIRLIGRAKQPHFKEVTFEDGEYNDIFIFSPDNTILIVGIGNGDIELWDVVTGDTLSTLEGHSVSVEDLKFSPDHKTLISVGGGNIILWDWEKVLSSARGADQEGDSKGNLLTEEKSTETPLQFLEHSTQKPKASDHILWNGEIYLANEWFEFAYAEFVKYLSAADYQGGMNVTTPPNFHRQLFARIGKIGKEIQDKEGFANMVNKLIDAFTDSLSIQLNGHFVLAIFYYDNGFVEEANAHIHEIDTLTANLSTDNLTLRTDVYLSLAKLYRHIGTLEESDAYIQKIDDLTAELDLNDTSSLRLQIDTNFAVADHFREIGLHDKADMSIQKTGFVTEDAWMVLGPFDNVGGIGFGTAYIPEDITEIDLTTKYEGQVGPVSWKKFTDAELDGYIHLGEKNVDWQVFYTFATVTSPDEHEVQFRFDSDDQGKVWLNGKEIFSHTKTFMAIVDTYTIPVTLKQGKNSILVKVCNEEGACAFFLRITDTDGNPFLDLEILK